MIFAVENRADSNLERKTKSGPVNLMLEGLPDIHRKEHRMIARKPGLGRRLPLESLCDGFSGGWGIQLFLDVNPLVSPVYFGCSVSISWLFDASIASLNRFQ